MSPAKPKPKQSDERRTVEEARRAFADSTAVVTAAYVFRLRHAWEAVAIGLPAIEALRLAEKSWDEIAAQLAAASGFPAISGQSVRVYRSRLKSGFYDAQLGRLGLRRESKILVPLVFEDEQRGDDEANDDAPAPFDAAPFDAVQSETQNDAAPQTTSSQISAGATVPRDPNAGGSSPTSSAASRGRYSLRTHPK